MSLEGINNFVNEACQKYETGFNIGYDNERNQCTYFADEGKTRCAVGIMLSDSTAKLLQSRFSRETIGSIYSYLTEHHQKSTEYTTIFNELNELMAKYSIDIDELCTFQFIHDTIAIFSDFPNSNNSNTGFNLAFSIWRKAQEEFGFIKFYKEQV